MVSRRWRLPNRRYGHSGRGGTDPGRCRGSGDRDRERTRDRRPHGRRSSHPVVSDAGVPNTFGRLVPVDVGDRLGLRECLRGIEPSTAMVALYVGLKQSADQLGLTGTNLWIHAGYDHDAALAAYVEDPARPLPVAYISFPSAKDPTFECRHPGRATIDVLAFAPYRWFRQWEGTRWKRRGEDYDVFKERLATHLLEQLHRHVPQVRGKVDYWELSTPLSNRHFADHPFGEVYGISHTPDRFRRRFLRPATPIRNLYLTGSDVLTEGVTGAMFGGVVAASAILKRPLLSVRPPRRAASIATTPGPEEAAVPELRSQA